jgi:uncharacterized surface protein with fasciclin (FAS1) repeats
LTVTIEDGKVFINGFEVLEADVAASNGTIHVINGVIVPADVVAELTAPPAPSATPTKRP